MIMRIRQASHFTVAALSVAALVTDLLVNV